MNQDSLWRPTRRRLTDTLLAALAPVAVCGIALGGLTTWVGAGNAGSPARVAVTNGRVFLPYGDSTETAAFFDLTNTGGADDRLVEVTSSSTDAEIVLSRHRMIGDTAATRTEVASAAVPAGRVLAMSPDGLDVVLSAGTRWKAGDLVPFTLHFERTGAVETLAVVVRPSS
ncbi:copper chaperone PCu(A)C [Streptomyces sp. S3(2020)]|uniref:copper chaperone PCu(A)C n=1 Tax=Streptomyces sp. S3(2020) TaxID=2732044 RepID=UPI0014878B16|nr:copper chaperone PCu(A)C [Streptomyces sp. S3(2020)]NNN31496.1 copper chaperone PCu(A)C [Streptomyces sp. S3(2020)]